MSKTKEECGICFLELDGDIIICPACGTKFHEDHLAAWLRLKNNQCPHCRSELPLEFIEALTPKTSEEKQYLDSLEYLFGDLSKYNRMKKLIDKKESELKLRKQGFFVSTLMIIFAFPFLFFLIIQGIYENSNSVLLLIIVLSVILSIYVRMVSLLIKARKTNTRLEHSINVDRQKILDL